MQLFIDVGSTNIKYATSGLKNFRTLRFPKPIINQGDVFEVNPEEIVTSIKSIIDKIHPDKVYLSTQMHGYLLFNEGKRVTNYISWRDERGKNEKPQFTLTKDYGVNIKPNLPRLSLQTQTVAFDEFMTLGSYIAYALTGNNASHITDITPTGLYNRRRDQYDELPFSVPKVCQELEVIGKYGDILIYSPVGDQQCSIKGVLDYFGTEEAYVLNIGTASQLCCVSAGIPRGEYESRPYFENKTLCTVTRLPSGMIIGKMANIDKAVDFLYQEYKEALEKLPSKNQVFVTGGGAKRYRHIIEKALKKIGINYTFNDGLDAVLGLSYLANGGKNMKKAGIMLSEISHHSLPVIMKNSGLDFFILDYEHGGFDYEAMANMIMTAKLCDLKCIVRLPNNERKDIIKVLDMGANGLLLPMTNDKKDIEQVVRFAKYPPLGLRGVSTMRAHTLYNPGDLTKYMKEANEQIEVYAQIETEIGVKNINDIINIKGVNGVMIGPNDLSADYRCLEDKNAKPILEAIKIVAEAAKNANKQALIITSNQNYINQAKEAGFVGVCVGSELNAIKDYCMKVVKDNR